MPDTGVIRQLQERMREQEEAQQQPKRGRGRPKGSKDKKPRKPGAIQPGPVVDPATGIVVNQPKELKRVEHIGDERVTAFVQYHMDMLVMRQGVDKHNVADLQQRFINYLSYCASHQIVPNNMNAYFAIGITRDDIYKWKSGASGSPEHKKFAEEVAQFFASIHEQGPTEGLLNPISAMFWQKAHDGMIEAQKLEVTNSDPLGEKVDTGKIAEKYADVELPD